VGRKDLRYHPPMEASEERTRGPYGIPLRSPGSAPSVSSFDSIRRDTRIFLAQTSITLSHQEHCLDSITIRVPKNIWTSLFTLPAIFLMAAATAPIDYSIDLGHRRDRKGISTILSIFTCCCSRANTSRSQHFHANRVEDSVHVMIKHDIKAAKKKGSKSGIGYVPRVPLSDRLAAARVAIQATEDTFESNKADKEILAALSEQ